MSNITLAAAAAHALAAAEAQQLGSRAIDTEHVFIGLLKLGDVAALEVGKLIGLDAPSRERLESEARDFAALLKQAGVDATVARRRLRALWIEAHPERESFDGHRTPDARRIYARAQEVCVGRLSPAAMLWALLERASPLLERALAEAKLDRAKLMDLMTTVEPRARHAAPDTGGRGMGIAAQFGRDLTALAKAGKLSAAIGRDEETKQVGRVLLQAKKANPLLVGEAGVGKTAIVEGLALRLAEGRAPAKLKELRIVEVSLGALVAGTSHRGEFEERVQAIIAESERDPTLVVFIDEVHQLLGAGAGKGAMDAANLLKPALARGGFRCIGATTTSEYRKYIEKDAALERRFQVVWVNEPSREQSLAMLQPVRATLEGHHGVKIGDDALHAAIDLSIRHLPDHRLPDKAIDLLDQACSRALLSSFTVKEGAAADLREVGRRDIAAVVSERCQVPVEQLSDAEGERLLQMEETLRRRVIGQDQAVAAVSELVRSARVGLRDARRPLGVFLFLGPTGSGKTELAKALAEFLFGDERKLIRIDMSEYGERHALARLIGAPPGYVGYEAGGQLTDAVRAAPYSVVLFDEAEKAHPDVFDLFLQIFDDGRLTDGRGRSVSFADTLVILTSNLGTSREGESPRMGFDVGGDRARAAADAARQRVLEAVEKTFRPELRNRIQKQVVFRALDRASIAKILDKILRRSNVSLAERGLTLELQPDAREHLVERGYDERFGARALERVFADLVEAPLGKLILEGRVEHGDRIEARLEAGGIVLRPGGA